MALTIAELVVEVGADIDGAVRGMRSVSDRMTTMGTSIAKQGVMLGAAIAPATLAFGGAVRSAGAFEEAMTNARAVLGVSAADMAVLNDEILRIGAGTRAGPQAAAEAFYDIVSGVPDATTHMAILTAAIATAEAGSADLGATTNSLVAIMNAYGFAADDATRVSDILTATVGVGVLTMEELAAAMPQVTGMGKQMGVEFEELGMAMAFLTTKGFSASEASTQIGAAMVAMVKPTAEMERAFRELGVSGGEELIAKFGGLQGALTAVTGTTAYAEEGMGALFGRVEAMKAVMALTGEGAEEFAATFADSIEGATEAAQAIQLESMNAQIDLLNSQAQALGIEVGRVLVPALTRLATRAHPVVAALTGWVRENPKLVTGVAAVVAGIAGLAGALSAGGAALAAVGTVLGVLLSPIGLVIAAVALLGLAFKTNFLGFGDFVRDAFEDIKGVVGSVVDWFRGTADAVKAAFEAGGLADAGRVLLGRILAGLGDVVKWTRENITDPIINQLKATDWGEVLNRLSEVMEKFLGWGASALGSAGQWLWKEIVSPAISYLSNVNWAGVASRLVEVLKRFIGWEFSVYANIGVWLWEKVIQPLGSYLSNVNWANVANRLLDVLEKFLGAAGAGLADVGTWIYEKIIQPIIDTFNGAVDAVFAAAKGIGQAIFDAILEAVKGLPWAIAKVIDDAIPNKIDLGITSVDLPDTPVGDLLGTPPGFATGGIAMRPMLATVAEREPEAIIPLSRLGEMGGGGITITGPVYVQGVQNPAQLLEALQREARRRSSRLTTAMGRA